MQANFCFSAVDILPNLLFENFTNTDEFTLNAALTTTNNSKISERQVLLGNSHYLQLKTVSKKSLHSAHHFLLPHPLCLYSLAYFSHSSNN